MGEKAFGLAALPSQWTLPFFVVSDDILDEYRTGGNNLLAFGSWADSIKDASIACGIQSNDPIIVRSNSHSEGLYERDVYKIQSYFCLQIRWSSRCTNPAWPC